MNSKDIDNLIRWAVDSDLQKFSEDAYGITGSAFDRMNQGDDYLSGKFKQMQNNFIMWIASLDGKNRGRLARNITFNEWDKEENKASKADINEIGVEATKIIMRKRGE